MTTRTQGPEETFVRAWVPFFDFPFDAERVEEAEMLVSLLVSPEPWKVYGQNADDYFCCDGTACGCRGVTVKQDSDEGRTRMPKLLFVRVEERQVGKWEKRREVAL